MPSTRSTSPWQIMRTFFVSKGYTHRDMDDAASSELEGTPMHMPMGKRVIRERARTDAVAWLAGASETHRTAHALAMEAKSRLPDLNPFVLREERQEYRNDFLWEVDQFLIVQIALGRAWRK